MGRKIGIITHWDIPNYGTFLQAYGLQKSLDEMFPNDEIYLVAYMNEEHRNVYYSLEVHELYKYWLINPYFYLDFLKRIKDYSKIKNTRKFHDFYLELTNHTKELNGKQLEKEEFDVIILGSDILWDYSIIFFGNDKHMFGGDLNAKKIISYAASFGTVKPGMEHPEYVRTCIKKLDAISVRDNKSGKVVKEICNTSVTKTVDPTWLWDFNKEDKVIETPIKEKYIVIYGADYPQNMIDEAIQYAREKGYLIVYLDGGRETCDWCDIFIPMGDVSPFEWCGYMKGAEVVMTCSFHGLMFAINYKRKIVFSATQFMKDKSEDIINELGLKEILIDNQSFLSAVQYSWDFSSIWDKINILREKSKEYLLDNLKQEEYYGN